MRNIPAKGSKKSDTEELEALPDCVGMRRSTIVVDSEGNLVI